MRTKILAASALATAIISGTAFAQTPKAEEDHSAHHPAGSASAASASAPSATPSPEAFNQQMKAMQDMHQKMQAAKSPAERAKLMEDHMRIMQSGMAMMSQMRGGASGMGGMSGMSGSTSGGMGGMPPSALRSEGLLQLGQGHMLDATYTIPDDLWRHLLSVRDNYVPKTMNAREQSEFERKLERYRESLQPY